MTKKKSYSNYHANQRLRRELKKTGFKGKLKIIKGQVQKNDDIR